MKSIRMGFALAMLGAFGFMTSHAQVEWPKFRHYDQNHIQQIVLPLGGIGTGTIGLTGRGELRDWELFNAPNVRAVDEQPEITVIEGR